jgi:hypothetical protein
MVNHQIIIIEVVGHADVRQIGYKVVGHEDVSQIGHKVVLV